MIRIGLCDDNNLYIDQLTEILKSISVKKDLEIEITSFNSGEDLTEFCKKYKDFFDILFLDVLMGGMNGINTAKVIRDLKVDVYIVFVTSSKEYALDSYSVNAFSYILKPFSYESIEPKFLEICEKVELDRKNVIYVKNNQDIYTLKLHNVMYFESNLRKVTAYMSNGEHITFYNKLSKLEEEIEKSTFVRCHRSFLVNLTYIKNVIGSDLITTNGNYLPISKKFLNSTKDIFTDYIKAKISY